MTAASFRFPLRHGPPRYDPVTRCWKVTRYRDAVLVLRDPNLRIRDHLPSVQRIAASCGFDPGPVVRAQEGWALFQNPPRHAALRRWLIAAQRRIAPALGADAVGDVTRRMLRDLRRGDDVDAVTRLCDRIPEELLADALDVPVHLLAEASHHGMRVSGIWQSDVTLRSSRALTEAALELEEAAAALLARMRTNAASPLADIVRSDDDHDLSESDLVHSVAFLIIAATETTGSLLANALAFCLIDQDARNRFASPSHVTPADVDEILRVAGPFRILQARSAAVAIEAEAWTIPAGAVILVELDQAIHDPAEYADPFRFAPDAPRPPALGFGIGAHACIGAAAARAIAQAFLSETMSGFEIRLATQTLEWERHSWLRRLQSLPIRL